MRREAGCNRTGARGARVFPLVRHPAPPLGILRHLGPRIGVVRCIGLDHAIRWFRPVSLELDRRMDSYPILVCWSVVISGTTENGRADPVRILKKLTGATAKFLTDNTPLRKPRPRRRRGRVQWFYNVALTPVDLSEGGFACLRNHTRT